MNSIFNITFHLRGMFVFNVLLYWEKPEMLLWINHVWWQQSPHPTPPHLDIFRCSHWQSSRQPIYQFNIFCWTACNGSRFHNYIKAKPNCWCEHSTLDRTHVALNLVTLQLQAERTYTFLSKQFKFNHIKIQINVCWRLSWQLKQCICPRPASVLYDSGCSWRTAR